MKLKKLLNYINFEVSVPDLEINAIQLDSRKVNFGDLFIAIPGLTTDGRQYIQHAITNGAIAVLAEEPCEYFYKDVPIIVIPNLSKCLGDIANYFYMDPSSSLQIVGITGTNGKSSICHYIENIITSQTGIIGTLGVNSGNTTPDCLSLNYHLADMRDRGFKYVAMEVSSHALDQARVADIKFNTVVFTNLSQDHLDYHKNMSNYWQAKLKLFLDYKYKNAIINLDDPYGRQLLYLLSKDINVLGYTLEPNRDLPCKMVTGVIIKSSLQETILKIGSHFGNAEIKIPMLGGFNISNVLAAVSSCIALGIEFNEIIEKLPTLKNANGRLHCINKSGYPLIIVDYAHTPDALQKVLALLRSYCKGKLWCVFGCGGDRDRSKRHEMLSCAISLSDQVVITQDNPRNEDPHQIVNDMLQNNRYSNILIEMDRATAIEKAIQKTDINDIVLIAGKGHENYQIVGSNCLPFSDFAVAKEILDHVSLV